MTPEQINAELDALRTEATGLLTLKSRTPEQVKRMTEVTTRLNELKVEGEKNQAEDLTSKGLKDAMDGVDTWLNQVPDSNRPPHIYDGDTQKSQVNHRYRLHPPHVSNPKYKTGDIPPAVAKALRQDGYSDKLIEAHTSKAYNDSVTNYIRSGGQIVEELTFKAMTEGGEGGVLVPMEWGELITHPPMGPALASQVTNVPSTSLTVRHPRVLTNDPKYPASPVAVEWEGETPAALADQGSNIDTDQVDITCHQVMASGQFSLSLLEDNAYNLNSYIPQLFDETLSVNIESKLISGTGSGQPWGFLEQDGSSNYLIPIQAAAAVGAIAYNDMVNLMVKVWQRYRATGTWLMNSVTWGELVKIKDTTGKPIFMPGFGQATAMPGGGTDWSAGTFLGRPYLISEFVDSPGANKLSLFYGDFRQGIIRRNRIGSTIKILDQTAYKKGCHEYVLRSRIGARLVRPQAIAGLKHPAS
jgi:HK97 family phage major capsid protein